MIRLSSANGSYYELKDTTTQEYLWQSKTYVEVNIMEGTKWQL